MALPLLQEPGGALGGLRGRAGGAAQRECVRVEPPRDAQGEQGTLGPHGEVTNAAMAGAIATAIADTSNNTNGVALLNLTVSDPPAQAEMQAIANKIDEMISAQRR